MSTLRSRPSPPQTALSNYKARGVNVPHRPGLVSVSETRYSRQQMYWRDSRSLLMYDQAAGQLTAGSSGLVPARGSG